LTSVRNPPGAIGFAVAGGQSERMGRDKALLPWRGVTLLEHTLRRLRETCGDARILSGPEVRYGEHGDTLVDVLAGAGPLGGVCAALEGLPAGAFGLFLAVDLPHVTSALLSRLVSLAPGFDAVVPMTGKGPEPLCAVYGRSCLGPILRRLDQGERKMTCFWPDVRVRVVGEAELAEFGAPARLFRNINTSDDFAGADSD
jgi:molybdopterin-guanine dinucleotide biosynthesis protein A